MKTVLIIHGWPQRFRKSHIFYNFFHNKKYNIIAPYLFSSDFKFTLNNLEKYILKSLGKNKPDLIVGMSIGGLIAPHIAKTFPKSKLILVASGIKFNPKPKLLRFFAKNQYITIPLYSVLKVIPNKILFRIYNSINPFYGIKNDFDLYEKDMKQNIEDMKKISIKKFAEILNFVQKIDNKACLENLKNVTLIMAGNKDIFMQREDNIYMAELINHNKLLFFDKSHFDVLTRDSLSYISRLL